MADKEKQPVAHDRNIQVRFAMTPQPPVYANFFALLRSQNNPENIMIMVSSLDPYIEMGMRSNPEQDVVELMPIAKFSLDKYGFERLCTIVDNFRDFLKHEDEQMKKEGK